MSGRAAVVGAGVAGLSAAYDLTRAGWTCDVYERWAGLGGQAATMDVGGAVPLERYYHHLFTSDKHIAGLYRELGIPDGIRWLPSSVAFFAEGRSRAFTTPLDLLRFSPLSLRSRVRMGATVLDLQLRHRQVEPFERLTAHRWIVKRMGREAWETIWGPLLRGKFGDRAEDISMAWLWSKLTLRRQIKGSEARGEVLGYPTGGFEPLFRALAAAIEGGGGRVLVDRPATSIAGGEGALTVTPGAPGSFRRGHDPRKFEAGGQPESYDAVVATTPNGVFERLLDDDLSGRLSTGYVDRLRSIEYHAALCLVLEIDRRFSPFYWTNVADRELPFVGLIEQTNLVDPGEYGGGHYLYVANYTAQDDPLLEHDADGLLAAYTAGLRKVNPAFEAGWVSRKWLFREPDAQPIVDLGYRERIPPLQTGVPGLLLANTTQVYPEDRGTNYAVELGRRAARLVVRG